MIRLVLFDLDDTLYPERDFVLSGFRAVAACAASEVGLPPRQVLRALLASFRQNRQGVFNRVAGTVDEDHRGSHLDLCPEVAVVVARRDDDDLSDLDILVEALNTTDNIALQVSLVNALASIGDIRSADILTAATENADFDEYVREAAVSALPRLDQKIKYNEMKVQKA